MFWLSSFPFLFLRTQPLKAKLVHWLPWSSGHSGLYPTVKKWNYARSLNPRELRLPRVFRAVGCQGSSWSLRVCSSDIVLQRTHIFCLNVLQCIFLSLLMFKHKAIEDVWSLVKSITILLNFLNSIK